MVTANDPHFCYAMIAAHAEILVDVSSPHMGYIFCCVCSEPIGVRLTKYDWVKREFRERWICKSIDEDNDPKP